MLVDFRSDTVTLPTEQMRSAMAAAEVGDDVYGEDPTLNRLQEAAEEAVGKDAALFVPTGTMGNLLAVKCHTQPGDEVVIERKAHILEFEMGGMAWFSGVMPRALDGRHGILDAGEVRASIHSHVPYYQMRTTLVCLENTHNYGGGAIYPLETLAAIRRAADDAGVPIHMDGARLFNAAVAQGVPAREIAQYADSVMFSFSKGLSAPVGSVLCGTRELVERARRFRRVVGGGMRQAGVLAAAALVALETMVERLAEDHAAARRLAEGLAEIPEIEIDPECVQTNIVMCLHRGGSEACRRLVIGARERGVLVSQLTPDTIRMVTHRHITVESVEQALRAIAAAAAN